MLFGVKKTLYDHVTEALLEKERTVSDITMYLKSKKVTATFQGIYKALNELMTENIVIKRGKIYLINNAWKNKMTTAVSLGNNKFELSPGERMTYEFNKITHVDRFWKHTWIAIEQDLRNFPIVEYIPHQFWLYLEGRKESEYEYYDTLKRSQTTVYTNIGGTSILDKLLKKSMAHDYHQINTENNLLFNRRDHIVLVGPYIITTRISKIFADQVDTIYKETTDETMLEEKISRIFEKSGPIKLTLEHDALKAGKLRKIILKNFYVSKELREKFELF